MAAVPPANGAGEEEAERDVEGERGDGGIGGGCGGHGPCSRLRPHRRRVAPARDGVHAGGRALKVIGCSSLRGGGGELGYLKTLTYGSN